MEKSVAQVRIKTLEVEKPPKVGGGGKGSIDQASRLWVFEGV